MTTKTPTVSLTLCICWRGICREIATGYGDKSSRYRVRELRLSRYGTIPQDCSATSPNATGWAARIRPSSATWWKWGRSWDHWFSSWRSGWSMPSCPLSLRTLPSPSWCCFTCKSGSFFLPLRGYVPTIAAPQSSFQVCFIKCISYLGVCQLWTRLHILMFVLGWECHYSQRPEALRNIDIPPNYIDLLHGFFLYYSQFFDFDKEVTF